MFHVFSYLFRVLHFPHEGKIVTVDQLSFFSFGASNGNIPYVENTNTPYESVGASPFKYYALMGNFSLPPLHVMSINIISIFTDPWIVPSPDQVDSFGDVMPLSPLEQAYQEIVSTSMVTSKRHFILSMHLDTYSQSP